MKARSIVNILIDTLKEYDVVLPTDSIISYKLDRDILMILEDWQSELYNDAFDAGHDVGYTNGYTEAEYTAEREF